VDANVYALCTRMLIYMKDASEASCRGNVEKANQFKQLVDHMWTLVREGHLFALICCFINFSVLLLW